MTTKSQHTKNGKRCKELGVLMTLLNLRTSYGLRHCHLESKALPSEMTEITFGLELHKPKMLISYGEWLFR